MQVNIEDFKERFMENLKIELDQYEPEMMGDQKGEEE